MLSVIKRKPMRNQMYFDFIEKSDVPNKKTAVSRKQKNAVISRKPGFAKTLNRAQNSEPDGDPCDLTDLCLLLHGLARKHVSVASFSDFCLLARCTKLLQTFGAAIEITAEMQSHVGDSAAALVTSAPEYRMMRSKAVAGLATVADLADRLPAKGSADYQRGMRDAYQHASDIAALFLDDLEQFQVRVQKPW